MNIDAKLAARLQFLARVIAKESHHLASTDQRLFTGTTAIKSFANLETDVDLAERVEAFVGRFSRLQDTLGDKLLPALLSALGEKTASVMDNLDRAERLGLIVSAEQWLIMRSLRNQMVHEYVEDTAILENALRSGHQFVAELIAAGEKMTAEITRHDWL
ncbi:MAG: hypothetical protein ABL915_08880 [Gallionella sp.]